jgi:2-methylcitrate dehydratase PrpD
VTLADGTTLERDFPHQKGGPENPMSDDEVREKFRLNAELALPPHAVDALETAILAFEQQDDLTAALQPVTVKEAVAA